MTPHRLYKALSICLLLATQCLSPLAPTAAQSELRFGENIGLLLPPVDEYEHRIMDLQISPNGLFVFGNSLQTYSLTFMNEAKHYIWNIQEMDIDEPLVIFESYSEFVIPLKDQISFLPFLISPNSQFIAVQTNAEIPNDEVQILQLPEMSLYNHFPKIQLYQSFVWSMDSENLLLPHHDQLSVWNIIDNRIVEYDLSNSSFFCRADSCSHGLQSTEEGWLLKSSTNFFSCTANLTQCYEYALADDLIGRPISSPAGQLIIRSIYARDSINIQYHEFWEHISEAEYHLVHTAPGFGRFLVTSISPNLHYVVFRNFSQYQIWSYPGLELIQELDEVDRFNWLPDGEHFVIYHSKLKEISLYTVGNDVPVDSLNLSFLPVNDSRIFSSWGPLQAIQIPVSGDKLMLDLGWGALIIPIEQG